MINVSLKTALLGAALSLTLFVGNVPFALLGLRAYLSGDSNQRLTSGVHSAGSPLFASPRPSATSEFHRALQVVMIEMDASMCITPSADADRDFARAMIPHHQGAVEMARLELIHGRDPRLRRLAQGMIVEQSQEIALMRSILVDASPVLGASLNP